MDNLIEVDSGDDEMLVEVGVSESKRMIFQHISNSAEIRKRTVERIPEKNRHQGQWGVNVWKEWANLRNGEIGACSNERYTKVPENIIECSEAELGYWLVRFVLEVRRKDGKEYPPMTLYQVCCALQRHLQNNSDNMYNIIFLLRHK